MLAIAGESGCIGVKKRGEVHTWMPSLAHAPLPFLRKKRERKRRRGRGGGSVNARPIVKRVCGKALLKFPDCKMQFAGVGCRKKEESPRVI